MNAFPSSSPILSSMSVSSNLSYSLEKSSVDLLGPLEPAATEPAAAKGKRCCFSDCKKKLLFSDFACRCGTRFCTAHRAAEDHRCTYDWKAEGKKTLGSQLGGCVNAKLERI